MLFSKSIRCPCDRFTKPDLFFSTKQSLSFLLAFVYRSIYWQMFFKAGVLNKFHKFQRKISVLESNFSKVPDLIYCNFIKKRLQQRCFLVKFAIFLTTPFFTEYFQWLLLRLSDQPMHSKYSSWWRRLDNVFVFRWRLQDVWVNSNIFALLIRLQKTSSRCLDQDQYIRLVHTSSRHVQDVFKTAQHVLPRRLQDVFKASSRRFQDVFKTSSKTLQDIFDISSRGFENVLITSSIHLQDVLQRCLQDVFKTYYQVKLFLITQFQDVFETYSKLLS